MSVATRTTLTGPSSIVEDIRTGYTVKLEAATGPDGAFNPLPYQLVRLYYTIGSTSSYVSGTTNSLGTVVLYVTPDIPGQYVALQARYAGVLNVYVSSQSAWLYPTVVAASDPIPTVISLEAPAEVAEGEPIPVTVRLTEAISGLPIVGASVEVDAIYEDDPAVGYQAETATTDANGVVVFTMYLITLGEWTVTASFYGMSF